MNRNDKVSAAFCSGCSFLTPSIRFGWQRTPDLSNTNPKNFTSVWFNLHLDLFNVNPLSTKRSIMAFSAMLCSLRLSVNQYIVTYINYVQYSTEYLLHC